MTLLKNHDPYDLPVKTSDTDSEMEKLKIFLEDSGLHGWMKLYQILENYLIQKRLLKK